MPSFKTPQYTKITNPKTRAIEPCYTFLIEYSTEDDYISLLTETEIEINLITLQKSILENVEWWNNFINIFLESSHKYFSKPYTIHHINKITKHAMNASNALDASKVKYPANIIFIPKTINITGGYFIVNWEYMIENILIDIPDTEDVNDIDIRNRLHITQNVENDSTNTENVIDICDITTDSQLISEYNLDSISVGNSTDDALKLDNPSKYFDKQRIKEAKLKAKLAVYKAQRQMARYYDKYGSDMSDSDTDTDTDTDSDVDS